MEDVHNVFGAYFEENSCPGLVYSIVHGHGATGTPEVLCSQSAGYLSLEDRKPIVTHARMNTNCAIKPIISSMAMLLIERGYFTLDDNPLLLLEADLGGVDPWWRQLTVRHLLTHTCGFGFLMEELSPRFDEAEAEAGYARPGWTWSRLPQYYKLKAPPGTVHHYTTSAFCVLAVLIEKFASRDMAGGGEGDEAWKAYQFPLGFPSSEQSSVSRFLIKEFWEPLQTRHRIGQEYWQGGKDTEKCPAATTYQITGEPGEKGHSLKRTVGSDVVFSASSYHLPMEDNANFFANVDKILKPETMKRMLALGPGGGDVSGFGLGWQKMGSYWGHGGGGGNQFTAVLRADSGLTISAAVTGQPMGGGEPTAGGKLWEALWEALGKLQAMGKD
jgi:hypothetical protein